MLIWLMVTFGVAICSAVFPLLSVEVFVVGLVVRHPNIHWLLLGAVIAVGQLLGKLLYYYAGRGSIHLPAFLHSTKPAQAAEPVRPQPAKRRGWHAVTGWSRARWAWLRAKCHDHPRWMFGATTTSAVIGVPPFMATTVLAGLAGLSLRSFVAAVLPGRFVRFSVLAASPKLVAHWLPWHLHLHPHLFHLV